MKVLQINNFHSLRGGADRIYLETGHLLARKGHEIMWFSGVHPENLSPVEPAAFAPVADLKHPKATSVPKFLYNRTAAQALEQLIQTQGKPDIAHLHIYHGGLTTAILPVLRRHQIPIVQTAHEYKLVCPVYRLERQGKNCMDCISGSKLNVIKHRCKSNSALQSVVLWAESFVSRLGGDLAKVDKILCVSARQKEILAQAGIPKTKLTLCHNFVDTTHFKPVPHTEKQSYFLYFGRIETLKGLPTLLAAAENTDLPVKIVGEGSWENELSEAIQSMPHVEFLGRKDGAELRELIARAKAVIVPSQWEEPFGLTVVESLASGTAVIGSAIGAIPELLRDGIDGILAPVGDSIALTQAMSCLSHEKAIAMGHAGREHVENNFNSEVYIARLLEIYSGLTA
ncbi:glycosyltransferase family 4 protein [Epibacterium ulvae]|uniref:glycosyltransferase family 4 protein n=1 Tax=Epibacterium ulvae TaxID=1156985 RepID=UPI00248F929C|nr:glycosyltransferase family 4 protein [Epibacterium ulvae]